VGKRGEAIKIMEKNKKKILTGGKNRNILVKE